MAIPPTPFTRQVSGDCGGVATSDPAGLVADLTGSGAQPVGRRAWDAQRIENGEPRFGFEIKDDVNPLEIGLTESVSVDKGCYTGQEVIARLDTYDKVARRLILFGTEEPVEREADIELDGSRVGVVTSIAEHPEKGGYIELGLVSNKVSRDQEIFQAGGIELSVLELHINISH